MESPQSSTNHHFLSVYSIIYRTECKLSSIVCVKDRCMEGTQKKIMSNKYHNINNSNKQQTNQPMKRSNLFEKLTGKSKSFDIEAETMRDGERERTRE